MIAAAIVPSGRKISNPSHGTRRWPLFGLTGGVSEKEFFLRKIKTKVKVSGLEERKTNKFGTLTHEILTIILDEYGEPRL